MQVDIHHAPAISGKAAGGLARTQQSAPPGRTAALSSAGTKIPASYPDRPLISAQPLRYNVQLNQQITAVQQADNFLQNAEKQTLQLVHAITRRASLADVAGRAEGLCQLLAERETLSAGYVDRQMQLNLQSRSLVAFRLQDGSGLLNSTEKELLTFSLAGQQRELSAASLEENASPRHNLLRLNQALGKWGIKGRLDADNQLLFEVDEQRWQQVSQHLSVQGEGKRYPQGQFYPVRPQAAGGLEETVNQLRLTPASASHFVPLLEKTLDTLTQQRHNLQQIRDLAQQRIDSMATFSGPSAARQAAKDLAGSLQQGGFTTLTQALAGQANLTASRVRNVLSTSHH